MTEGGTVLKKALGAQSDQTESDGDRSKQQQHKLLKLLALVSNAHHYPAQSI